MKIFNRRISKLVALGALIVSVATYQFAFAHCDTADGPVAHAARASLAKGNVDESLWWVQADDEAAIRKAFDQAMAARKGSAAAKKVADQYFLETLVRIHRQGEGVGYTGVKPAGTPIDPAIAMADRAIATGKGDELANEIAWHVKQAIKARFAQTMKLKEHAPHSVAAGREYVAAYVEYFHTVEAIDAAVSKKVHHEGHGGEVAK